MLSFCQSLSALHSQCLSPHSLAGGGVRSLGKSRSRGSVFRAACVAVGKALSPAAPPTLSLSLFPRGFDWLHPESGQAHP